MPKYIALLRGINISGKNKIAMRELKPGFEELGFCDVKTHLNSGNVVYFCDENDTIAMAERISAMIRRRFALDIPVLVLAQQRLREILAQSPDWWGTQEPQIYDNLIFILPGTSFLQASEALGAPKEGLERIENYEDVVFWSFSRKEYQKTNWYSKTATAPIRDALTIRTANTVRKLAEL